MILNIHDFRGTASERNQEFSNKILSNISKNIWIFKTAETRHHFFEQTVVQHVHTFYSCIYLNIDYRKYLVGILYYSSDLDWQNDGHEIISILSVVLHPVFCNVVCGVNLNLFLLHRMCKSNHWSQIRSI